MTAHWASGIESAPLLCTTFVKWAVLRNKGPPKILRVSGFARSCARFASFYSIKVLYCVTFYFVAYDSVNTDFFGTYSNAYFEYGCEIYSMLRGVFVINKIELWQMWRKYEKCLWYRLLSQLDAVLIYQHEVYCCAFRFNACNFLCLSILFGIDCYSFEPLDTRGHVFTIRPLILGGDVQCLFCAQKKLMSSIHSILYRHSYFFIWCVI